MQICTYASGFKYGYMVRWMCAYICILLRVGHKNSYTDKYDHIREKGGCFYVLCAVWSGPKVWDSIYTRKNWTQEQSGQQIDVWVWILRVQASYMVVTIDHSYSKMKLKARKKIISVMPFSSSNSAGFYTYILRWVCYFLRSVFGFFFFL